MKLHFENEPGYQKSCPFCFYAIESITPTSNPHHDVAGFATLGAFGGSHARQYVAPTVVSGVGHRTAKHFGT